MRWQRMQIKSDAFFERHPTKSGVWDALATHRSSNDILRRNRRMRWQRIRSRTMRSSNDILRRDRRMRWQRIEIKSDAFFERHPTKSGLWDALGNASDQERCVLRTTSYEETVGCVGNASRSRAMRSSNDILRRADRRMRWQRIRSRAMRSSNDILRRADCGMRWVTHRRSRAMRSSNDILRRDRRMRWQRIEIKSDAFFERHPTKSGLWDALGNASDQERCVLRTTSYEERTVGCVG
jgi:tellurite resistance-related uncharacterized protein